jgi:hypothetical protein
VNYTKVLLNVTIGPATKMAIILDNDKRVKEAKWEIEKIFY